MTTKEQQIRLSGEIGRMYSIIIITYNSEKYILEALESVRFQIEKYGKGRTYQLILADDCSRDRTRECEEKWLNKYGKLFEVITKSYQAENAGTCKNVADAVRLIKGDLFFLFAGDDLFSFNDVFSVLEEYREVDVLASVPLVLFQNKISRNIRLYYDALASASYTTKYIKWSVGLGNPIIAGAAWKKELNTERVLEYMQKFMLLDDRSRYYAIWHSGKNIHYEYTNKSLMIYRKNEESVSNKAGKYVNVLQDDLIHFFRESAANSTNWFYKLAAKAQLISASLRGKRGIHAIRYLTPYYFVEMTRRLLNVRKMRRDFQELMKREYKRGSNYLLYIQKNANEIK